MKRVLVSACLLGERVRYDGREKSSPHPVLTRWLAEGRVVKVCPEVEGGLPVPRPPAEQQRDGRVLTDTGLDVTDAFTRGGAEALRLVHEHRIEVACSRKAARPVGAASSTTARSARRGCWARWARRPGCCAPTA